VRSLQITPVPGVRGTATITVTVSDGILSSSTTFLFGVGNVPVLSWPSVTSSPLMYGTPATTSNVLKATSSVPGSFVYNPANGSILPPGNNQVVATFTPTDTSNYLSSTITNTILVLPASVFLSAGSTTWVCPSNVTAVQVECWGGGGAGGSAQKPVSGTIQCGGGGAGGAYARLNSFPVVPGITYYINVGAGGVSSTNNLATVAGGDSWFNSNNVTSTLVLAKGGAGGQSVVTTSVDAFGTGGTGTTIGSIGNILFAGGSGATSTSTSFGGGGGGSAGILSAGNAPASTINGLGAVAVTGGGNGGNANRTAGSSGGGQSPTGLPGGGGGGARAATTAQQYGGTGAVGQVIVSVKTIAANLTLGGLAQTYDGNPKSVTVTTDPANLNIVVTYNGSTSLPTAGGSYAVVATINENNYAGSVSGTLVIAKISQTITFGLDPATATVGDLPRTLIATSSSALPVTLISSDSNVATIIGNTLNIVGVGTATLTATQTGDGNYEAAVPVSVSLTVSAAPGTTFASWSGNAAVTSDLVSRYAFGALSKSSAPEKISSSITPTTLSLTAVVRTDDPKLVITPKSVSSLSGTWSGTDPVISVVNAADQSGLETGLVRKVYSVERGIDSKRFLKLEAVYTP